MSSALFTPLTKYCLWSPVPIKPRKVAPFQTAPYTQAILPRFSGLTSVAVTSPFGLCVQFPGLKNQNGSVRTVWSEAALNVWEPRPEARQKMLFYPLPGESNAWIVGVEAFTGPYDYQDFVVIVRNVRRAAQ